MVNNRLGRSLSPLFVGLSPTRDLRLVLVVLVVVNLFVGRQGFVSGFAAKKTSGQKEKGAVPPHKGFGKPPLSIEQRIAANFPHRKPKIADEELPCPCRQQNETTVVYADCCKPYHEGIAAPKTPTDVLRSRYSAFVWRIIGYLIKTTHPTCSDYREDTMAWAKYFDEFCMFDNYNFEGLTILGDEEFGASENEAFVEFQVRLRARKGDSMAGETGETTIVQEKSRFVLDEVTGVWTYASGDIKLL